MCLKYVILYRCYLTLRTRTTGENIMNNETFFVINESIGDFILFEAIKTKAYKKDYTNTDGTFDKLNWDKSEIKMNVDLDFADVTQTELMQLAGNSLIIKLQTQIRKNIDDAKELDGTLFTMSCRQLLDYKPETVALTPEKAAAKAVGKANSIDELNAMEQMLADMIAAKRAALKPTKPTK